MDSRAFGDLVNGAIPILFGIYSTLLGYRVVGKKPMEDLKYDVWHDRYSTTFRIFGPILIVFGIFLAARGLIKMP